MIGYHVTLSEGDRWLITFDIRVSVSIQRNRSAVYFLLVLLIWKHVIFPLSIMATLA